jgi:Uma2 family endonuclease
MMFSDWLDTPDDGRCYELYEGELYVNPAPNIAHQRVCRNIGVYLEAFLRQRSLGEVFFAPTGLRLSDDIVFEPDIIVVLNAGKANIEELVVAGPADVVVEVLSKGTAKRDLALKRNAYQAAGVREYWIADPVAKTVTVLSLVEKTYVEHGVFEQVDALVSTVLSGLSLPLFNVFPS